MDKIRIVTRNSNLALWQANFVKDQLVKCYPDLEVEIIGVTTSGDKILAKSLDKVGGKGLFIKELENALLENLADIAVHSLKDLPARLNSIFSIGAILKREDAADAFVSNKYKSLDVMPNNAVIGTSSARRIAILKQDYPHLNIKLLRGNIQTRLAKLDNKDYDGIILAVAGLKRLNLSNRITQRLQPNKFLPAIGQGALAVEILSSNNSLIDFLKPLNDITTSLEVGMERQLGSKLNASCSVPIAIYARSIGDEVKLDAMLWDIEDNFCTSCSIQVHKSRHSEAVDYCLNELNNQGVQDIITKYE
jgi:hydroxymethylbilane synthase